MPGYTTNTYRTLKNVIQDLINSGKIDDPERQPNDKTNHLPEYQDTLRTKNKSLLNYPTIPQPSSKPDIISFGSHAFQASDGTPTLTNPTYPLESYIWSP